jgi:uncharacterized protein YegL
MPSTINTEKIARKLLPIIYVIDTSGSMIGDRISSVNEAMHDAVGIMKEVSDDNPTAEIKIGVIQFDTDARWITKGLVYLEDYYWNDLSAGGVTDMGAALGLLDKALSRSQLLSSDIGYKAPVVIFMTDGYPSNDYIGSLNKIRKNKWFACASKIGIGIGDDFDGKVIAEIVGNSEAVIQVSETETLKKLIRVVSVTASMVGSKSRADGDDPVKEIMQAVSDGMSGNPDVVIPDPVTSNQSNNVASASGNIGNGNVGWDDDWD